MNYQFENVTLDGKRITPLGSIDDAKLFETIPSISFEIADRFSCDLTLTFRSGSENDLYKEKSSPVLFLYEFLVFLRHVGAKEPTVWHRMFSPFAWGMYVDGHLLISSRSGEDFFDDVYDRSDRFYMKRIERKATTDLAGLLGLR